MFGSRAQNIQQYLSKGTKVVIQGKLRWSQWERDGQKRSKIEVVIDDIDFSNNRNGNGNGGGYSGGNNAAAYSAPSTPVVDTSASAYDADIPF